jgi:hypothetical protein
MARYFFNYQTGDKTAQDLEGVDLPSLEEARIEALRAAREVVSECVKAGRDDLPDCIVITSGDGRELAVVPLREVLPPALR